MMKIFILILVILFSGFPGLVLPDVLLGQWRYPREEDFKYDWATYRSEIPEPFHVTADFDGNGLMDSAWILFSRIGPGWGLFAIMNESSHDARIINLFKSESEGAQYFGIQALPPGKYITACGKGYWECSALEPPEITLQNPGFSFFKYESASTMYFWDKSINSFHEIAESD